MGYERSVDTGGVRDCGIVGWSQGAPIGSPIPVVQRHPVRRESVRSSHESLGQEASQVSVCLIGGDVALPDCIDVRLWIEIGGIDGRCYLFGNCGTSLGRMYAFSETLDTSLCVSKHEIVSQSDESAYWIDGFLHGTAPFGDAMFGPRYDEELDDLEPRWIAVKEFIRSGETGPPTETRDCLRRFRLCSSYRSPRGVYE